MDHLDQAAYSRLLRIIDAARPKLPSRQRRRFAQRLARAAGWVVAQEQRPHPKPTGPGRPPDVALRNLIGELAGIWLDLAKQLPGVSYVRPSKWGPGVYKGSFVRFVQDFCKELANDLQRTGDPALIKLRKRLRVMQDDGTRVRSALRSIGAPQLKAKLRAR